LRCRISLLCLAFETKVASNCKVEPDFEDASEMIYWGRMCKIASGIGYRNIILHVELDVEHFLHIKNYVSVIYKNLIKFRVGT